MDFEADTFSGNQIIICSNCGKRITASNYYKNKENIICEECYIEARIDRGRKTHWQYIKSVKNDYLVPGKADAIDVAFRPKSGMKSSLSISPGCVGEICLSPVLGMLMLVSLNGNRLFRRQMIKSFNHKGL